MNSWRIISALWGIGNFWLRFAIALIAFWPIIITIAAFIGWPALTATVTLLPLVALIIGLLTAFDPMVLAVLGTFGGGRKALAMIAMIIGSELAVGIFFSAVPVANDRGLIPLALVTMLAIVFFMLSGVNGKIISALVIVLTAIAVISFIGGRGEVSKAVSAATTTSKKAEYPICADTEEGVKLTAEKPTVELPLDKGCWSGWVSLPDNYDFKADNGKGGEIKVMLFNGKIRSTRGDGKGGKLWDGNIGTSSFRLLGGGVAKITATPKTSGPALKVVPTPPAATPPAAISPAPPAGAIPTLPAKPISPNGGVV